MAKRWYSVSVLSNFEKKIAEQIRHAVEDAGLEDQIEEVLVPTEEVIEIRRGKKVTAERRFMPGPPAGRAANRNIGFQSTRHRETGEIRMKGYCGVRISRSAARVAVPSWSTPPSPRIASR